MNEERVSLLERLKATPIKPEVDRIPQLERCNMLAGNCPHCRQHGVIFSPQGVYAHAQLCHCVSSCRLCLGRAFDVSSGTAKPCQNPSPLTKVNLFNQAQIPVRYAHARIENFQNNTGNCQMIIGKIKKWLDHFKPHHAPYEERGLIIAGGVGVGKTYLLTSLAKRLAFMGLSVRFIDFYQLIAEIKARYSLKQEVEDNLLAPLLNVDVLVIDELGKGRRTDFEQTIIDQLVMGRYNQQKMILASTNCSLENKETSANPNQFNAFPTLKTAVGERIYSRLQETCHFWTLQGEDFRDQKEKM